MKLTLLSLLATAMMTTQYAASGPQPMPENMNLCNAGSLSALSNKEQELKKTPEQQLMATGDDFWGKVFSK